MDEKKLLKYSIYLINTNVPEAVRVLKFLVNSKDNKIKLQATDAVLTLLDSIKDFELIIKLCDEAIDISKIENRLDNLAYFQIKKASSLAIKIGGWKYIRAIQKLAPGWFNFSTEKDRDFFNRIDNKILINEKIVDKLCRRSIRNAKNTKNNKLLGVIYLYLAPIWQNRCMDIKIEKINRPLNFLPESRFKNILKYKRKDLLKIDYYFAKSISNLTKAINIFEEVGDRDSISYCLNNLTNYYLNSFMFRKASLSLSRFEDSIKDSKDTKLLINLQKLKDRLKNRNQNIPDYIDEYKDYMAD